VLPNLTPAGRKETFKYEQRTRPHRARHRRVLDEADAFTIEDLCQRIYGGTEKKHRVAVLRATRQVLKRRLDVRSWRHGVQGGPYAPIVLIFLVARARVRARETKKISAYLALRPDLS
jgi:hypothetical protein